MEKGFYFYTPKVDYFFVTEQQKKTQKFVEKINETLKKDGCVYRGTFGDFNLSEMLQPGTIEKKESEKFGPYYDIKGDGWSAGDFVSNKRTEIFHL